jgi:hypothetical protein
MGKKITRSRLWRQKVSLLSRKAVFAETIRDGLPVVDKDDGAWTTVGQASCRSMSEHHRRMQRVARQTRIYLDQIGGGNWLRKNWNRQVSGTGMAWMHWKQINKNIFARLIHLEGQKDSSMRSERPMNS